MCRSKYIVKDYSLCVPLLILQNLNLLKRVSRLGSVFQEKCKTFDYERDLQ